MDVGQVDSFGKTYGQVSREGLTTVHAQQAAQLATQIQKRETKSLVASEVRATAAHRQFAVAVLMLRAGVRAGFPGSVQPSAVTERQQQQRARIERVLSATAPARPQSAHPPYSSNPVVTGTLPFLSSVLLLLLLFPSLC